MFSRLWSQLALGVTAFIVASTSLVAGLVPQAGTIVEPWVDTENREAVAVAFANEYGNRSPDMDWTGNYETCDSGDSSTALARATVRRVNFYRAMAGVPTGVRLNPEYSAKAQHAALSMSATGRLSHTPDDTYACLDDTGREAAANSNLYLGRTGPEAIDGYIEDPGDRNRDVGHRNTILHPPTTEIGVGHVSGSDTAYPANALWVFDEGVFEENPPMREAEGFVAWPPRGFIPPELIYPRWSFGLADAVFENATITMTSDGEEIDLEVVARLSLQGYVPAPIIVWEPVIDGDSTDGQRDHDQTYDIAVRGVEIDGESVDFAYSVTVMGEQPKPAEGDDDADHDSDVGRVAARVAGRAIRVVAALVLRP